MNVARTPDLHSRQRLLFGLWMDALTMAEVVERCLAATRSRERLLIGVLNAAKVIRLRSDRNLRDSLLGCDLLLADGQSVVWASQLLRRPLPERVAGIDLFAALLTAANREDLGVYLLGGRPDVLRTLESRLITSYPTLRIVGRRDGYFTQDESAQVADQIRESGADLLFLGMVSPKKEIFVDRWGPTLEVPVLHGVGGSFDIFAGITKRAPVWWQRAGMEWAYRLLQEPRRMWRRYLTTNTAFLVLLVRELIRPSRPFARGADGG